MKTKNLISSLKPRSYHKPTAPKSFFSSPFLLLTQRFFLVFWPQIMFSSINLAWKNYTENHQTQTKEEIVCIEGILRHNL